jgi:ribosomal protein S18 acetylase RimI-like enzyme
MRIDQPGWWDEAKGGRRTLPERAAATAGARIPKDRAAATFAAPRAAPRNNRMNDSAMFPVVRGHPGLVPKASTCYPLIMEQEFFPAAGLRSSVASETFVPLRREHELSFARFLADLEANGDHVFFHPHPFDAETARMLSTCESTPDEYWLLVGDEVLAYGMLRGWAEGYSVPSLGLAVSPRHRGRGLARAMMHHLHTRAAARGASHVRLKVARDNHAAHRLYQALGYVFREHSPTELLGTMALADGPDASE